LESVGEEGIGRAFVALPCPGGLRREIAAESGEWRRLDADVRWVEPENAHLTLRFLGRASREALAALDRGLRAVAARFPPVTLAPGETGAFPGWRRPRVLWLGLEDGGALAPMAGEIEAAARDAGFASEERAFRPHLTLGRVRSPRGAPRAVKALQAWRPASGAETAGAFVLQRSDLGSGGPRYSALETYALTGRRT
jgi:2'-5' RNA ligase